MQDLLQHKLFKEVCVHYETYYKLQPLTARIYALFVLNNCREGFTFDELLDIFQASKSSISHSINTLIELSFIEQYKKENERKRYFRVNRNLFLLRLEDVYERLMREKEINEKLREYRKEKDSLIFNQEEYEYYIAHIDEVTKSIEKTIQNLKLHINSNEKSN